MLVQQMNLVLTASHNNVALGRGVRVKESTAGQSKVCMAKSFCMVPTFTR